jgi:hypothetical protein
MQFNEQKNVFTMNAYPMEIYRNEQDDYVISQPDLYCGDECFVVIAQEQLAAVIKALKSLKSNL